MFYFFSSSTFACLRCRRRFVMGKLDVSCIILCTYMIVCFVLTDISSYTFIMNTCHMSHTPFLVLLSFLFFIHQIGFWHYILSLSFFYQQFYFSIFCHFKAQSCFVSVYYRFHYSKLLMHIIAPKCQNT